MIHVFVKIRAKPDCIEQLHAGIRDLVVGTLEEPGNVTYEPCVSDADPAVVRFFEVWQDEAAVEAHRATPHMRTFFDLSKSLLAERPEIDNVQPV